MILAGTAEEPPSATERRKLSFFAVASATEKIMDSGDDNKLLPVRRFPFRLALGSYY